MGSKILVVALFGGAILAVIGFIILSLRTMGF